jgi:hypothetical protein
LREARNLFAAVQDFTPLHGSPGGSFMACTLLHGGCTDLIAPYLCSPPPKKKTHTHTLHPRPLLPQGCVAWVITQAWWRWCTRSWWRPWQLLAWSGGPATRNCQMLARSAAHCRWGLSCSSAALGRTANACARCDTLCLGPWVGFLVAPFAACGQLG